MTVPYQVHGRVQQKTRTRDALLAATRRLLAEGTTPTVEEAASAASISRTTAYRYFPTQHALLVATHPMIDQTSVLGPHPPSDVHARFSIVLDAMERQIVENETVLRTMLKISLEEPARRDQLVLRQGRRRGWVADALSPLRATMSKAELDRLVLSITSATGIESFVWLNDVAKLSKRKALALLRFSGTKLLESASAPAVEPAPRRRRP